MTASPLSFDKQAQSDIIQHLSVGVAGDKTALIDSLASSVNLLKNSQATSKIIILLTDGEDTASRIPLTIIEKLIKKYNIKLYTIGIGESNKHLLNRLITFNQGKAFYASSKQTLNTIYEEINQLETSKINNHTIIHKYYLYHYFVFLSLFLLLFYLYLRKGSLWYNSITFYKTESNPSL